MTTVTGTGHGTAAPTAAGTVPGHTPTAVSDAGGHGAGRHAAAVSTVVDTAGALDTDTDTAGGLGTDTAVVTNVDTDRGPVTVTMSVTKPGHRRFLIFGSRRTRRVGHVTVPVPVSMPAVSTAAPARVRTEGKKARQLRSRLSDSDWWLWAVIWSLTAVTTWMASSGQVDTWKWAGLPVTDNRRFGVPFVMELAVVGWLLIGKHAVKNNRSPYPWWGVAVLFSSLAVFTNSVHGTWRTALIFGTASAVSLAFWFAKFYLDYIGSEVEEGMRSGARPKVLGFGSIWQPRIDFRAFLIVRRREQVKTVERARELAELWIWVSQDTAAQLRARKRRWGKRRIARRTAWMTVNTECGVKVIVPKGVEIVEVTFAAPPPAPPVRQQSDEPPMGEWTREVTAPRPPRQAALPAAPTSPAPAGVPDIPEVNEVWFQAHAARIGLVQRVTGDGWWKAAKPLSVDTVQAVGREHGEGLANRTNAKETAACLRRLRALRLVDELAAGNVTGHTPGGD